MTGGCHFGLERRPKWTASPSRGPAEFTQVVEGVAADPRDYHYGEMEDAAGKFGDLLFAMTAVRRARRRRPRYKSPDDLALSPDGKRLFVGCAAAATKSWWGYGDPYRSRPRGRWPPRRGASPWRPREAILRDQLVSDTVSEVDAATLEVLRTLPAGFEPTGITPRRVPRNVLYVANRLSDDVSLIDLADGTDAAALCGGPRRELRGASPDGAHIYVSHGLSANRQVPHSARSEITELDAAHRGVANRLALNNAAGVFHIALLAGRTRGDWLPRCGPRT